MNLLRLKRKNKNKKKIGLKRYVLLIFSLIMTSFAWFAFSKVLNTNFNMHMVSWDVIFKKDGGVITDTESIDFAFTNLYPGSSDKIVVDVENNGESAVEILYLIKNITILGKTYNVKQPGETIDENSIVPEKSTINNNKLVQNIINTNTKINNNYLLENAGEGIIVDSIYVQTPFTIKVEKTEKLLEGEKGKFEISIDWPEVDSGLANKDSIDSTWGYTFAQYFKYCTENNIDVKSAISINVEIDAVQYIE